MSLSAQTGYIVLQDYKTRNSAIADKLCDMFRGQSRSPNLVPFHVRYGLLLVCGSNFVRKKHHFWAIRHQKCRDLESRVKGLWRSLKMAPFEREPMTSYWCSIVTMGLSLVISEIFNVDKYHDLEIPVMSQSRSLKVVPFDRMVIVSYYCFIVTFSLTRTVFWNIELQICRDLENQVRGPSMSLKMS